MRALHLTLRAASALLWRTGRARATVVAMVRYRSALAGLGLLLGACSCASSRQVIIETSRPAQVRDQGGRLLCAATPCAWTVSRETCFGLDSSSGYVLLTAITADGVEAQSVAWKTCELEEGQHLRIEVPPPSAANGVKGP
jgi:hypothetical protein